MTTRLIMQVTNQAHPYFRRCKPAIVSDDPLIINDKGDGNGGEGLVPAGEDFLYSQQKLWVFNRNGVFGQWFADLGFLSLADMLALMTTAIQPKLGDLGDLGVNIEAGYSGDDYLLDFDVPSVGELDAGTGLYTVSFAGETIQVATNQEIEPTARGIIADNVAGLVVTTWGGIIAKRVESQTETANPDYGRVHLFKHGWGWFDGVLCSPTATAPQNAAAAAMVTANPSRYGFRLKTYNF